MQSITEQFKAWVRTKPADELYCYGDNDNCAMGQFLLDSGLCLNPRVGGDYWRDGSLPLLERNLHPLPERLRAALSRAPYTFGALAERLGA